MSQKTRNNEVREKQQLLHGAVQQSQGERIMASSTRRSFLTAAPTTLAVGASLLAAPGAARNAMAQTDQACAISSDFNGTAISAGDWIWFTSVMKVHGLGSGPVTIGFMGSIEFSVDGILYVVPVPSALVTFSPLVTVATTVFTNGQWVTTVPLSGLAGNVFFDGVALKAPAPAGFPGGIQPVTWQGMFFSMTPGLSVQWQWAAAVYSNALFGADYTLLGVKPVDDNQASVYQNSDHAGTPEYFKHYVVGGARGGGGSNFTGSYSGTDECTPMAANSGGGGS